jgi:protein-tyrosine phosphatase
MENFYRRLPLTGLKNARDLGGYPTRDGGATRYRTLIRSEAPLKLTEADLTFLREFGVKT